jgi:hypothetical protein
MWIVRAERVADMQHRSRAGILFEMKRIVIAALAVLAFGILAAPAGAAQPNTPSAAAAALKAQLKLASTGQFGKLWKQMHPAEQAVMPQAVYITCASKTSNGLQIDNVEVVSTHKEPVVIPGTQVTAPSTAITVKISASQGPLNRSQTTTFHEFYVKKQWRFTATDVYTNTKEC